MRKEPEPTLTRNRQVEELFGRALDLAPDARATFLARACAGDEALRREVEELLEVAREGTSGLLPTPGLDIVPALAELHPSLRGLSLAPGARVGRYTLRRPLGQGGMGTVFLAHDARLDRPVAIKFLHAATPEMTQRFLAEAQTTARCRHDNIVVVHDVGELDGHPYMVLEYLEGESLRGRLAGLVSTGETAAAAPGARRREGGAATAMPVAEALSIITCVVRALVCAHEHEIVHRDLKPENIFLCKNGSVKVLDFGIAKALADPLGPHGTTSPAALAATVMPLERAVTAPGALLGTLPYMSPEQWGAGDIDVRTDIWAVGILLHEMLAGRHPLAPLSYSQLQQQVPDLDVSMPGIGAAVAGLGMLADVVDGCLRKRKAERIQSSAALLRAIEEARAASAGATSAAREHGPAVTPAHREAHDMDSGPGREPTGEGVHANRVFAAYASPDAALAEAALSLIGLSGTMTLRTQQQVRPGDDMKRALDGEIASAASVVVFWSRSAAGSEAIAWQIQRALAHGRRIIPVLLDDTPCSDALRDRRSIDLREHRPRHSLSEQMTRLLPGLAGLGVAALLCTVILVTTELGAGLHGVEAAIYWIFTLGSSLGAGLLVRRALTRQLDLGSSGGDDVRAHDGRIASEAMARSFRDQYLELT